MDATCLFLQYILSRFLQLLTVESVERFKMRRLRRTSHSLSRGAGVRDARVFELGS